MANPFVKAWKYVMALFNAKIDEHADPKIQIQQAIEDRHAARRRRDFAAADRIRQDLAARGVLLEDNAAGTRWKRK